MKRLDDLASGIARRWADLYTAGIESDLRESRRSEITSDLWEHRSEAMLAGLRPWQIGLEITSRWLLGIPADLSWRRAAPRAVVAHDGGEPQMKRISSAWWVVSTLVLAVLHLVTGLSSLDPGWIPPAPPIDLFAVVIVVLGGAAVVGVALRNRAPKLAGLLVLAGVWVPLFSPVYSVIALVFGEGRWYGWGPSLYLGPVGVILAVISAIGAVQNMSRPPVSRRVDPMANAS